jgi:hypothetical protein
MELRAELSRMSYEATGGVRENYRNNENPNVNLGGQEALQQFKKINPLTAEMIREYKDEEINKYKGEYIKPSIVPDIELPDLITFDFRDEKKTPEEMLYVANVRLQGLKDEADALIETIRLKEEMLNEYKAEYASKIKREDGNRVPPKEKRELRRFYDKYIKDLTADLKEHYKDLDQHREVINDGQNTYIPQIQQAIEENKKTLQESINRQKGAIYKYEEDLKQANMNRLNVTKQPNETEFQYFERLKAIADTKHDEEFYKSKAQLEQVKKLKDNMRKIIRNESMIENVVKYLMETTNIYEINKYFTLIEEEFLKVFGYNNKNLTFNDIVKSINTILERMGEVSLTEVANPEANVPPTETKIGNTTYITGVENNKFIIGYKNKNDREIAIGLFPVQNLSGSKLEFMVDKKLSDNPSPSDYERIPVDSVRRFLKMDKDAFSDYFPVQTYRGVAETLINDMNLIPVIEGVSRPRGRPRKESMLESPKPVEYVPPPPTIARLPVKQSQKSEIQPEIPRKIPSLQNVSPQPVIARQPPKLKPLSETAETLEEYEYKIAEYEMPIKKEVKNAFGNASALLNNPSSETANILRSLMMLKGHLIPEDKDQKYPLLPTPENKALINSLSGAVARAFETKDIEDVIHANQGIEKLIRNIKATKTGFGLKKRKPTKATKATKAVSQADKLRINLIIGEVQAGNNNPMLLKEINKLKKKYSR